MRWKPPKFIILTFANAWKDMKNKNVVSIAGISLEV